MENSLSSETMKDQVVRVIREEIGPALQMDGSGIEVVEVLDGVVRVRLSNVCNGCPSTIMMVIMGIEQELRRLIPGVVYLEAEY